MRNVAIALCVVGLVVVAPLEAQSTEVKLVTKDSVKKEKPSKPKSGGANVITEEEIAAANVSNALEAIQRLRPRMFQRRIGSSMDQGEAGEIVVWLDNAKLGYKDVLSSIEAQRIHEIRYLSPADATTRFGTGYTEGAIVVTTKR